jgi:hypothetical protein
MNAELREVLEVMRTLIAMWDDYRAIQESEEGGNGYSDAYYSFVKGHHASWESAKHLVSKHGPALLAAAQDGEITCDAWAILRPDGRTLHPESVRGAENAAQWAIGAWSQMERDGFRCVPVKLVAARSADAEGAA